MPTRRPGNRLLAQEADEHGGRFAAGGLVRQGIVRFAVNVAFAVEETHGMEGVRLLLRGVIGAGAAGPRPQAQEQTQETC